MLDTEPVQDHPQPLSLQKESSFTGTQSLDTGEESKVDKKIKEVKESSDDKFVRTFEGKLKTIIRWMDKDGNQIHKEGSVTFSDILLNLSNSKDFYAVWDGLYCSWIDNYAIDENGLVARAEKVDWI